LNVHEYQAKAIFRARDVPVPAGGVARTAAEARALAERMGGRVVLKAQIHAGGRGKGTFRGQGAADTLRRPGTDRPLQGVVVVDSAAEAADVAGAMLGQLLVTRQTGPAGRQVRNVLVEEAMRIAREHYLAIVIDRARACPVVVACAEGGMDIEEVAARRPEAILKVPVDPRAGYSPWVGRRMAYGLGLSGEQASAAGKLVAAAYRTFVDLDASLVEINPLAVIEDGRVLALDAKMNFDDNALFRRPEIRELRDTAEEDPLEVEASTYGLNYIRLDGNVGCMVNGAGLAMATMDAIQHHGGSPANFLDVGGGATAEMVTNAFRILLGDERVRAVLINIFGGIMRCDVVAQGVVAATRESGVDVPIVVRLEGTNVERGREILRESGLPMRVATGMADAAQAVVEAARGR
jgi:succinyl-CoA synthetase beta subunit